MRELGKVLLGCSAIVIFFMVMIMPNMAYSGYSSSSSCIHLCFEEYVALNGTAPEIEQRKKELAAKDEFSSIKGLWSGCAACHGQEGQGNAVFPMLAGQSADYITGRLYAYRNGEAIGTMSATMWSQASNLSDSDIDTIGRFIEETMK